MQSHQNTAIIIIDLLNDYFGKGLLKKSRPELVKNTNILTRRGRERGYPVIWVRQEFLPDISDAPLVMRKKNIHAAIIGTEGCQLLPDLEHDPADYEIVKKRQSAFFGTNLDEILEQWKITHIVICGIATEACIRVAATDAYQRDYEVFVPRECVASPDPEHEQISLRYLQKAVIAQVGSLPDILKELSKDQR